jgi:outer membrane autotransporter protein
MIKKSNFLKNLLTTASTLAVLTSGASSVSATTRTTTADNVIIGGVNTNLDNPFLPNDDVLIGNNAHVNITTGANVVFGAANGGLDEGGTGAAVVFTIAHNVTLAGANDFGTANAGLTSIIINAGNSNFGRDVAGNITVNNAANLIIGRDIIAGAGAGDLLANGGTTTVRNVTRDVTLTNGAVVNQAGTIGRNLNVGNAALYVGGAGADVTGTVTINTTNAGVNTLNNAAGAVTLTAGKLTMNDVTAGGVDVTVANNATNVLIMNNAARDLLANGGTTTVRNVTRDVMLTNGAVVNQAGTIGRNLNVGNAALYVGGAGADVAGTVTINTTNAGVNTLNNAAGAVTVNRGSLIMRNAGAGITVSGAAGVASATVAQVTGNVNVNQGGILTVSGNVTGNINNNNGADVGIVNLTDDGNVGGVIGAANSITKISVSGNRTFADAAFGDTGGAGVRELNFAADGKKVTLQNAGAELLATDVTLGALAPLGNVVELQAGGGGNQHITGAINAAGTKNAAGNFALTINMVPNALSTVTVNTANFKTNLTSTFDNKITLNLNAGSIGEVGNLGSQGAKFVVTNFDQAAGAEVSVGNIYSDIINIRAGKVAKFRGEVVGTQTNLVDAASKARFADGATLDSAFVGTGGGLVEFEGGAFINKAIRGVGSVKFLAAAPAGAGLPKQAALRAGIGATTIEAGDTQLFALENVRMEGATTAKHVGADSGKNARFTDLKLTGDVSVSSTLKKLGGDVKTGAVIVENSPLNLQNVQSAIVVIDDTGSGAPVEGKEYQILRTESGVVGSFDSKLDVINLRDGSSALYSARTDNLGNIYLTQKNNSKNKIEEAIAVPGVTSTDATNLKAILTDKFIADELADMSLSSSKAELAQRLVASDVEAVLGDLTTRIGADLGSRMGTLAGVQGSPVQTKVVSNRTTGLSAGDDVNRYGAWISPFFNKSTQKSRKEAAGYTATTGGGSFGFDTKANDDMIVGLALSMLHTDVKHKNFKSGDKTKVDSVMFSVYGMQQITDNWFAQGIVTAGSSKVSTNEKRKVSDTEYQKASGKYTSMSFSGEALLGYNYVMDQVSITPMGGVRLTRVNDEGYKETGTTNQNLNISRKALNRAELVLGARVAGGTFDLNGLSVTPEIHGFLNQDVIGKASKVDMTTKGGTKLADKSSKPNKTMFNVGVGLNATYNSMEYGLGYDAHLANKYIGHQGTLKVRVNF